ncbi:MAG: efflux RND transporter periplasmic adaptor subunit [Pseudomonadota bacterium]
MAETRAPEKGPTLLRRIGALFLTLGTLAVAGALVVFGSDRIAANAERLPPVTEIAPVPVATVPLVARDYYTVTARYQGRAEARRQTAIGFEAGGTIAALTVDEGGRVAAGDVLARLDTRGLEAERDAQVAARDALAAQLELAELTAERQRTLLQRNQASTQRYDEARLAAAQLTAELSRAAAGIAAVDIALSKAELVAPFDAIVAARLLDEGARVAPGQAALELLEDLAPEFRIGLPEDLAATLAPGETLSVEIAGQPMPAAVARVRRDVDPETRTVPVILSLPDGIGLLPDGTLGTVVLSRQVPGAGAWVPITALSEGVRGLWTVFFVTEDGIVRREAVELVHAETDRAFVRGSFPPGTAVVADGTHRLADGQPVTIARAGG